MPIILTLLLFSLSLSLFELIFYFAHHLAIVPASSLSAAHRESFKCNRFGEKRQPVRRAFFLPAMHWIAFNGCSMDIQWIHLQCSDLQNDFWNDRHNDRWLCAAVAPAITQTAESRSLLNHNKLSVYHLARHCIRASIFSDWRSPKNADFLSRRLDRESTSHIASRKGRL